MALAGCDPWPAHYRTGTVPGRRREIMRLYSRTNPVGWAYHASLFCAKCGDGLPDTDPEGNAKHPVMGWETSELVQDWDGESVPMTCEACGEPADKW